ncbi:putative disease resistance protein RGA3 [Bienertia sinuspersici]
MSGVEAVGLVSSVVQTVVTGLQTREVREMCSMFSCETQLEYLKGTMLMINSALKDADSKRQGLSHTDKAWVVRLKDAAYDIDDLLDEFAIIAQQRNNMRHAKFTKKVSRFFSRNNKLFVNFNVSREIKLLRERLDAIVKDYKDIGFSTVTSITPEFKAEVLNRETSSNSDLIVIGRDSDKKAVVDILLSDSNQTCQNVSYVNIVGIGGLGKTTLAQLVYNDERILEAKDLGHKDPTLEELQRNVQTQLQGKKYLLVLDDVWNEKPHEWDQLKRFLVSTVSGSKIIVTTRSKKVATSIGDGSIMYKLEGLSAENSLILFKRVAFGQGEFEADPDLVHIGKDIVKRCANVPLPIRVIAGLLKNQDKRKWELFSRSDDLAKMSQDVYQESSIMQILMFSYYHLTPELKSCFSFCALFPKDRSIGKKLLIGMWLAGGFLGTSDGVRSLEDVGEDCFNILLNRCFFQDIELDEFGDVFTFKMHDLMHDLAVQVAGSESLIITPTTTENHTRGSVRIRHLSREVDGSNIYLSDTLRTYILVWPYLNRDSPEEELASIISNCTRLRVLRLCSFNLGTVTRNLGELLHLRYLDLTNNVDLKMLPKSITKLHKLQVLKLSRCYNLKWLPEDLSKLVNLRTLDIHDCVGLTHMPRGMSNLTNLHTLTQFVVGGVDSKQTQGSKLLDLHALRSLEGDLRIRIRDFCSNNIPHATERVFLLKDAHLRNLDIRYGSWYCDFILDPLLIWRLPVAEDIDVDQSGVHEVLVEDLCPNDDIRRIGMVGYKGTEMPSWASMIVMTDINGVQHVRSLSQFRHLKVVTLDNLPNVEYIESDAAWASVSSFNVSRTTFFHCLEKLELKQMPKLKGWWRDVKLGEGGGLIDARGDVPMVHAMHLPSFPRLHELRIEGCYSMRYFPPCPHVKRLHLMGVNDALTFLMKGAASSSSNVLVSLCLDKLEVNNGRVFNSILRDGFVGGAVDIELTCDKAMKSLGSVKEGFERCNSSLQHLLIRSWRKVNAWSIHHDHDHDVLENVEDGEERMPWKYMQSVSSLELSDFPKMVKLPKGLRYLTSLQSLRVRWCPNLEELGECIGSLTSLQSLKVICGNLKALPENIGSLTSLQDLYLRSSELKSYPESMRHFTSLTSLHIYASCDELVERCRPGGEDWHKIRDISDFKLL